MKELPRPARYLLRVDDLCPTVDAERWRGLRNLIREHDLKPILAVVPDNQDDDLRFSPPDPCFWQDLRELEQHGATIGIHGYRHLCVSEGKSLVPKHRRSEFAGLPLQEQRNFLRTGLAILREQGLHPKIWVAPRHGFDWQTLKALRGEGIAYLSDGLARIPFMRGGVLWIPQQLAAPVHQHNGLWTICLHPNAVSSSGLLQFERFLDEHGKRFTSFEAVIAEFDDEKLSLRERTYEKFATWRMVVRRRLSR